MSLIIEHYPDKTFSIPGLGNVSIDLHASVQQKLKAGEQLTNDVALKILKQIKWESDVRSFLTRPLNAICLSVALLVAGSFIPSTGTALFATCIFVRVLVGGLLGFSIENSFNGFLPALSKAYREQSERAAEYIQTLQQNTECTISFAL